MLDCLQRIEREMKTGDRLFRIAGDKFALLAVSEDCETVLGQAERILKRNGERVRYEGNDVALAMFGGIVELGKKDAWSASLFERLDEVLDGRWEMTKRRLTPEEAPDGQRTGRCRFIYPDYGFPTGTVYHAYEIREGALPAGRLLGYGIDLRKEREYLSFPLRCVQSEKTGLHQPQELSVRQEKLIIRWNQERLGGRMVFPRGENWCVFQVADRDGSVAREHFIVIRDLNVQRTAEGIRLSFEKLFLEGIQDGSIPDIKYPKALASLFVMITSVWFIPSIVPCTQEELLERLLLTKHLLDSMGIYLIDDEILQHAQTIGQSIPTK